MIRLAISMFVAAALLVSSYWLYRLISLYIEGCAWLISVFLPTLSFEQHWVATLGLAMVIPMTLLSYFLLYFMAKDEQR